MIQPSDYPLLLSFAARRSFDAGSMTEGVELYRTKIAEREDDREELIDASEIEEFINTTWQNFSGQEHKDILRQAIHYTIPTHGESLERTFMILYAALESALTFLRRQDDYKILSSNEFSQLRRDLRSWLKKHPLLEHDSQKRALIYEKVRELNRFPFSHIFKKFCQRYSLDLSDLWPVLGKLKEWPLIEIRHRLVHGDPFVSRPVEALSCATEHLRWTVERMILSMLGWPVSRSKVSPLHLSHNRATYNNWHEARAQLA